MLRRSASLALLTLVALPGIFGCAGDRAEDGVPPGESRMADELVGRLLLPGDGGRRGVELHAWVAAADGAEHQVWVFAEDDGRFRADVAGEVVRVSVVAGSEVERFDTADLPRPDADGRVDLGRIDLRDRVVPRRARVRAAEGTAGGPVRAGLWIGPPGRGPNGELPSLGSRQFPSYSLGSEIEWLLPPDADAIHLLVERPIGPGRGVDWRSGERQLFGPFDAASFPLELVID